jgi:DNA-binding response OmpR family regulator
MRKAIVGEAPRLLLVGCAADFAEVLRHYFHSEGYEVSEAADPGETESALAGRDVATVILDCVDGEVGVWLRLAGTLAERGAAPILINGDPRKLRTLRDSPWPVLAKPFQLRALHILVEEALRAGTRPPVRG